MLAVFKLRHFLRVAIHVFQHFWAWPHDAHIPFEHVQELRQFINAVFTQKASDRGDALVIDARGLRTRIAGIAVHGAELDNAEHLAANGCPFLLKKQCARAGQFDGDGCTQHERAAHHQADQADHNIHCTFDEPLDQGRLYPVHVQKQRIVNYALLGGGNDHILQLSQEVDGLAVFVAEGLELCLLRIGDASQKYHIVCEDGLLHIRAGIVNHIIQLIFLPKGRHLLGDMLRLLLGACDHTAFLRRIDFEIKTVAQPYKRIDQTHLYSHCQQKKPKIIAEKNETIIVGRVHVHDLQLKVGRNISHQNRDQDGGKHGTSLFDAYLIPAIDHGQDKKQNGKRSHRGCRSTAHGNDLRIGDRQQQEKR